MTATALYLLVNISCKMIQRGWLVEQDVMRPWGKIELQLGCKLSM